MSSVLQPKTKYIETVNFLFKYYYNSTSHSNVYVCTPRTQTQQYGDNTFYYIEGNNVFTKNALTMTDSLNFGIFPQLPHLSEADLVIKTTTRWRV